LAALNSEPYAYLRSILRPCDPCHTIWSMLGASGLSKGRLPVAGRRAPPSSAQLDKRRSRRRELAGCRGQASWTAGCVMKVHTVAQVASIGASEVMTDHSCLKVRQAAKSVGVGHRCAEFWG